MEEHGDASTGCRLKIEANGFTIIDEASDGIVLIERHHHKTPALICSYNFRSIRSRIADIVSETVALREVCLTHNYFFEMNDVESWKMIATERPDLIAEAQQLENSSHFLPTFGPEIATWINCYMKIMTPEAIQEALDGGFRMLLAQVVDNLMEAARIGAGLGARKAKSRQRTALKVARKTASSIGKIQRPGGQRGKRSKSPRFTYQLFCAAVSELGQGSIPLQTDVAKRMGYKGANADDQLRAALRRRNDELKEHNHKEHKWKKLCEEILSRD